MLFFCFLEKVLLENMEKEKRFRPIPKNFTKQFCANIHKEITESYIWNEYLENVLLEMAKRDDMNDAFCSEFAVPISSFHSVPFVDVVKKCDFIGIRVIFFFQISKFLLNVF